MPRATIQHGDQTGVCWNYAVDGLRDAKLISKCPANTPCVVERTQARYPSSQSRLPTLRAHFGNIHLLHCLAKGPAQLERGNRY